MKTIMMAAGLLATVLPSPAQAEEAEEEGEGVITLGNPIDADIYHISVYSADVKSELSDEV